MKPVHTFVELKEKEIVEVETNAPARVMLMDDANFAHYLRGERYSYHGSFSDSTLVYISPPRPGRWYVVVDSFQEGITFQSTITVR